MCVNRVYKYFKFALRMFKVQKPETVNKTFRLPKELVQELQTVAQNQGVSLNKLVQQCCEYALKNLDKE